MTRRRDRAPRSSLRRRSAAECGAAEPRLVAIDHGAHALPGSSTAPSNGVQLDASRDNAAASGWRLDSARRAACSSRSGSIARGIGDARLGQRQRAGLVEHDSVGLGQPFDGVAGIEDDAGAEQRAGSDHLHGWNRQRQRAGTGDDQYGNRRDDRVMQPRAGDQPADPVSAAVTCTIGA